MAERENQKRLTREGLLAAARGILARGEPLTVAGAAQEAGISKATAYRYFSDPALMAAEAGLDVRMEPYEAMVAGAATVRARLVAISLYHFDLVLANEAAFRAYLGLNLQTRHHAPSGIPRRGARRISGFRRALAEMDPPLPPDRVEAIAAALGVATGVEAMIALLDVARCSPEQARAIVAEISEAICDRMLGPA